MKEYVTEEKKTLKSYSVTDDFKNFMDKNEERLTEEFNAQNGFQTSVRGIKIRGAYSSQAEAELRAKKLRESDPNHDIFVGPVGIWMPWDPDAYKTGRVEFMEEELNQLHHEKLKNEEKAKQEFDQRVRDAKRKAIEENVKKARESGNKLTQTMTEDGELVGVTKTVNFEERDVAEIVPSNGFGKATVEVDDGLDRVD
jgi:predicted ATP-binding protein involved in virulence